MPCEPAVPHRGFSLSVFELMDRSVMATIQPSISSVPWGRFHVGGERLDTHGWGFACLMLVVAALFLRPADLLPMFDDWPIYQMLIASCLFLSLRTLWFHLARQQLSEQPVTACLLMLLVAVGLSHLANGFVWGAHTYGLEFAKFLALYLLIVGLVTSPDRLLFFVRWLTICITVMASISLLDEYNVLSLSTVNSVADKFDSATLGREEIARIRGTGIFADPNDLGLVVVSGIVFSLFFAMHDKMGWLRYLWLIPTGVLYFTLVQTHSRGALLSLAAVIPAWFFYRRGWKLALCGTLALAPVVLFAFAGRMTQMDSVFSGTGQSRIQLWSDSLMVFRNAPLLGIGAGMYDERYGVASHNSFLHCFVELGLVGGAVFMGAFLVALAGLLPTAEERETKELLPPTIHLKGYVFAALVGYAVGILTLSRQFVGPTYLMLGLAAATQAVNKTQLSSGWKLSVELCLRLFLLSLLFLLGVYLSVRVLVRW